MQEQVIYLAWFTSLALLTVLAVTLGAKRMWGSFPLFMAYVVADLLQNVVDYSLYHLHSVRAYMYSHWTFELLTMFLGLGVVYEIFNHLFAAYGSLRRLATTVFQITAVGLLLAGCFVIYHQSPAVAGHPFVAGVLVVDEYIRMIELGLLVGLFAFSSAFGLHWRQSIFGIGLGLTIFIAVQLAGITLRAHSGPGVVWIMNLSRVLSFNFSLLVWLGYLLAPERVTSTVGALDDTKGQLEQWNQAVKELIYQ